jgi:hypothetical protein
MEILNSVLYGLPIPLQGKQLYELLRLSSPSTVSFLHLRFCTTQLCNEAHHVQSCGDWVKCYSNWFYCFYLSNWTIHWDILLSCLLKLNKRFHLFHWVCKSSSLWYEKILILASGYILYNYISVHSFISSHDVASILAILVDLLFW